MYNFPIGVMLDSFRQETVIAIEKAAKLGAKGLQMYATSGEYAPEALTTARRRELLDMVKSNGLVFSALCGDLGMGFGDPTKNPSLVEKSMRILELAKELETDVVTTHIGVIPNDKNHERYKHMSEACSILGHHAGTLGAYFAVETGPETADALRRFLDGLDSKGVAVNLDPANFVMVTGDDPVKAVYTLKEYIVHTHAKDGRKLAECDPEVVYGVVKRETQMSNAFVETPLGEGSVDFDAYLRALNDIGYKGFLTIEREVGDNPEHDIKCAIKYLKTEWR